MTMEPRKYSTGTKGRIKMHSDKCKEFIHANSPSFSLANEFIASIDPGREEGAWQRLPTPADILPELQAWLGVEVQMPAPTHAPQALHPDIPRRLEINPASQLAPSTEDAALQRARAWLASDAGQARLANLSPSEAAEVALRRFYKELAGRDPRAKAR